MCSEVNGICMGHVCSCLAKISYEARGIPRWEVVIRLGLRQSLMLINVHVLAGRTALPQPAPLGMVWISSAHLHNCVLCFWRPVRGVGLAIKHPALPEAMFRLWSGALVAIEEYVVCHLLPAPLLSLQVLDLP